MIAALGLLARWVTFGGILATIGGVTFRFVVLRRARALDRDVRAAAAQRAATIGAIAAAMILPAALARLVVQTSEMRFPDDPWVGVAVKLVASTSWGTVWLVQAIVAALLVPAFAIVRDDDIRRWIAPAVLVLALSTTPTLSSHAMSSDGSHFLSVPIDWLHVLGAGAWIGTLAVMFVVFLRLGAGEAARAAVIALLGAFSPLALAGAGTVMTSGAVSALIHIDHLSLLIGSAYGRTLLAKLAAVALVGFFGWLNWKRNTQTAIATDASPLVRGMRAELTTVAIVLLLTALLVTTPPSMSGMAM